MGSDSAANASMGRYALGQAVFLPRRPPVLVASGTAYWKAPARRRGQKPFSFLFPTHTHTHTNTYTHKHLHTHTRTHIHTKLQTHTCTHAHTHNARYPSAKGRPEIKPSTHRWRSAKNTHKEKKCSAPRPMDSASPLHTKTSTSRKKCKTQQSASAPTRTRAPSKIIIPRSSRPPARRRPAPSPKTRRQCRARPCRWPRGRPHGRTTAAGGPGWRRRPARAS